MSTVKVRYVGLKDKETDHKAGTGLTWIGKGSVHEVPAAAWARLAKHPDVWELVAGSESTSAGLSDAGASAPGAEAPNDSPRMVDEMDDLELKAMVSIRRLDVDRRLKGEKLRAAVSAALKD